jgi:hypothetical protein
MLEYYIVSLSTKMPNNQRKKRGGGGATEFGWAAYNGLNPQAMTSAGPGGTTNQISVNPQSNCMRGGSKSQSKSKSKSKSKSMGKRGGTTMMDIAIPAALFAANHMYRPRSSTVSFRRGSKRNRFNRTRTMKRKY